MERVRIPASLNEPDVFLSFGPVGLSMKQLVTIGGCFALWIGSSNYMLPPFGLSGFVAYLAMLWLPIAGIALAFVHVRGRPLDMWLGLKFSFVFGPRTYILRRPRSSGPAGTSGSQISDEDLEAMISGLSGSSGPRAV